MTTVLHVTAQPPIFRGEGTFYDGQIAEARQVTLSINEARRALLAEGLDWPLDEIVALLGGGRSRHAVTLGPMAEIVFESLQHLSDADLQAMARYLKAMPSAPAETDTVRVRLAEAAQQRLRNEGRDVYASHCADCHGAEGEGDAQALALAGNRSVLQEDPSSLIRVLLYGGFAPSTARQPQPYGMPPFAQVLNQREQAAVLTYLRQSWGNQASAVAPLEIEKLGGGGPLW